MQGGDFLSGAAGGFFGSLGANGFGAVAGEWGSSFGGNVFFGVLSGGIGAELTGGNFWVGAVTGGIVAGFNHAMHKMGEDPGYLSMRKRHRAKKGGVVKVNTQKIDWSKADLSEPGKTKGTYRIKLSGKHFADINDALIHGTVTIEAIKGRNGYYRVVYDRNLGCRCGMFDFENHSWESPLSGRNLATFMGGIITGGEFHLVSPESEGLSISIIDKGRPFMIEYEGIFKIGK